VDNYGKLDILFNNAGIPLSMTPVENLDEDLWDRIIDVNTKSIYLAAKITIPIMKKQGGGVILNTCSVSAERPRPGLSAYTASKAAAVALTKALAIEVASFNIRVNSISPVASETPMFPGFLSEAMRQDMDKSRQAFLNTIPLGRFADPEDIAKGALYLASDEASLVTGVDLFIDGGRSI
jgi:3-oxoacyl-[acyl-carrier protein] reductase